VGKVLIREACFCDEHEVEKLSRRNGLRGPGISSSWNLIWGCNKHYSPSWPIGWVVQHDCEIVGFIGNIPRSYSFQGRQWMAAVARGFVVDEKFRNNAVKLIASFYQQSGVDILIFSSANESSADIYRLAKASVMPQKNYDKDLFWVVSPYLFVDAVLNKYGFNKWLSSFLSGVIAPIFYVDSLIRNRWNISYPYDINIESLDSVSSEIDKLWSQLKTANPNRFLADRDSESIAWLLTNIKSSGYEAFIFTLRERGVVNGYAIVKQIESNTLNLKRMIVIDLIVNGDNHEFYRALIDRIYSQAQQDKIDVVQIVGFPYIVRSALEELYPFSHNLGSQRFWYYTINNNLRGVLRKDSSWFASMFDGDSSI